MELCYERRCDECEGGRKDLLYCSNCIELLCGDCDSRIHNKGTRVSHGRVKFLNEFYVAKGGSKFGVTYLAVIGSRFDTRGGFTAPRAYLLSRLRDSASKGVLQLEVDRILLEVSGQFGLSRAGAEIWLEEERQGGLFLFAERCFDSRKTVSYVAMNIQTVSVQALGWVLLSLRDDRMQPVETLVHSRLKECFQMKVSMKDWKIFVEEMSSSPSSLALMNRYKEVCHSIGLATDEEGVHTFSLAGESWPFEDLLPVPTDDGDYLEFVRFIEEYFEESDLEEVPSNPAQRSGSSNCSFYSEIPKGKGRVVRKAIPGGKYGCSLLVKHCSTPQLQNLSLGKINALIRMALQNQVISHFKTLIIRSSKSPEEKSATKDRQVLELQQIVLQVLQENGERGVTLAQLPFLLSHKTGRFQNFQDLGFPKLKNFLATMDSQIVLEKSHNNHIKIYLRSAKPLDPGRTFIDPRDFSCEPSNPLAKTDFSRNIEKRLGSNTLKPNPFDSKSKQLNNIDPVNHSKSYSTVQQYFETIKLQLIHILNEYRHGIEIGHLETLLNRYTDHHFDLHRNKETFQDFLINNFDDYISISMSLDKIRKQRITTVCAKSWSIAPSYQQRPRTMHNEYGFGVKNSKQMTADLSDSSFAVREKRNEDSFNNFFEFQVISPIPSLTTSKMGLAVNGEESDESSLSSIEGDPDDNSLALVNRLLEENEKL